MEKQLEMVFLDSAERQFIVRVDDPRDDVSETEILTQMQAILTANVFETAYGVLVSAVKANIVTTETNTFNYA